MLKQGKKFEHEVHLGFLVIVFVLLFLNVVANYVVYRARTVQHDRWSMIFGTAALAASREVERQWPEPLSADQTARLTSQFSLSKIVVIASRPAGDDLAARQAWFASIIAQLPPGQVPELVEKLILSDYSRVTRGAANEYFFVYPVAGAGGSLLVLSSNIPEMAFLDDSARVLLYFGLGALALVTIIYLGLSRFIFSPFRRIKAVAQKAGRPVATAENDAEAMVSEYQSIIAELKKNEHELLRLNSEITRRADSLEYLHQYMLRSMQIGLVTLDAHGTVIEVNEIASRMLGVTDCAHGESYETLFGGMTNLGESIDEALADNIVSGYREVAVESKGSRHAATWGVTLSSIKDQNERLMGLSIWIADVTELVRLRTEVESKNRLAALGEMASGLAHQLRNSLGAIAGYGTLVKRRLQKAQLPAEPAESLLDESRQAENLISRFLTFARPFDYLPMNVEIDPLIAQIAESFGVRDDFSNITLEVQLHSGATIAADALLLKQAVGNIIDNAANAYPDRKGVVRVTTDVSGDSVRVSITDEGEGIPADRLGRIFTPFYSSRPSGTGLGLPLARKIVDLHQGWVTVESRVGHGTRFTLSFPLRQGAELPARDLLNHR